MPWTFAHPAVVLPIKQTRLGRLLNLLALVIGSVSPDLFYSAGLYGFATKAHYFIGWLYTGLPLSILVYLIFISLRNPLNNIIPFPITMPHHWNINQVVILIFSLFLGAITHIIWDGFTHETGLFVREIAFLQQPWLLGMTDHQEIKNYKVLQYASSLFGVIYLVLKYRQYQLRLNEKERQVNQVKLYKLIAMAIFSGITVFPLSFYLSKGMTHLNKFIFYELTYSVPVMFLFIVIYALWVRKKSQN